MKVLQTTWYLWSQILPQNSHADRQYLNLTHIQSTEEGNLVSSQQGTEHCYVHAYHRRTNSLTLNHQHLSWVAQPEQAS